MVGVLFQTTQNGNLEFSRIGGGTAGTHLAITNSGSVGIGTTSPSSYSAYADNLVVAGAGETGITIASGNSSQSGLYFSDGTSGTEQYIGYLDYNHSSNALIIGTSGAEKMRIDSSGDVLIGQTSQTGYTFAQKLVVGDGYTSSGAVHSVLKIRPTQITIMDELVKDLKLSVMLAIPIKRTAYKHLWRLGVVVMGLCDQIIIL